MDPERAPDDLQLAFALVVLGYSGVLAIVLSELAGVWSGMHSLAAVGLVGLGVPVLLVQSVLLRTKRSVAAGYQLVFWLSLMFPVVLAMVVGVAYLAEG